MSEISIHQNGAKIGAQIVGDHTRLESPLHTAPGFVRGYEHLEKDLELFWRDAPYQQGVFLMMPFPKKTHRQSGALLSSIHETIRHELHTRGLIARRADDRNYASSNLIWDNICIHMLGCATGIALLEDRTAPELNPNVTLEYGFMRALNRRVLLLREERFQRDRADLIGTISEPFNISDDLRLDSASVHRALASWLKGS